MITVTPEVLLQTVKHHLPRYFKDATLENIKLAHRLEGRNVVTIDGELVVDTGHYYLSVRQEGDVLIPTSNMSWDRYRGEHGDGEYGTLANIPELMLIVH